MIARIKPKIILHTGIRFFINEFLKKFSLLLNVHLFPPPSLMDIRLTMRCNLRCQQCYIPGKPEYRELPTELWKRIILDIKSYIGPYFLRFYGGEPFCRNDLLELINFCSRNDISSLITSNGTLIDKSVATELARNHITLINISLDGFKPETHDRLRGVKGTHQKVMRAIEYLQGKVPVQINTTIMNDNLDEILDLSEFAYKNKIRISFQGLINIVGGKKGFDFQRDHYLFPKDLRKIDYIIDELLSRKKYNKWIGNSYAQLKRLKLYYHHSPELRKKYCEAFCTRLVIKQEGDLCLCAILKPVGNLTQNSLKSIWKSKETAQKIKEMRRCEIMHCLIMRGCHKESYGEIINKVKRLVFSRL